MSDGSSSDSLYLGFLSYVSWVSFLRVSFLAFLSGVMVALSLLRRCLCGWRRYFVVVVVLGSLPLFPLSKRNGVLFPFYLASLLLLAFSCLSFLFVPLPVTVVMGRTGGEGQSPRKMGGGLCVVGQGVIIRVFLSLASDGTLCRDNVLHTKGSFASL